ncbi:UNVERIFIED_CONTAM: hypothetical protein Sradi_6970500 [Sesamum radiatum]|uniref:Reverse transcriptase domain-containing protein n=1 Tax=Sesamum radiatum TaxID=300843 RepID=A0AAW2JDZ8_SESRA
MEIWHVLLKLRIQNSAAFQYHWKCRELGIVNLCFADDVLIFCSGTVDSVSTIRDALAEFAALSGLEVNPGKSQIILSRSVSCRQQILETLGFQEGSLPLKYLGVPLVSSRLTIADCRPLIHKLDCRLAGWEQLNLSLAGRTQLIRSVLSSLHTYWASVFILPKSVIAVIEQRMRTFLWKGATGSGYAKVSWAQVCRPKVEGGLGIRSVLFMNQALMMKHLWRVLQADTSSIWVAWVLRYRLKKQTIWTFRSSNSSWCWNKLIKLSVALRAGLEYRVGNGHHFTLWTDIWHPQGPLLCSFPRGPSITGLPSDSLLKSVIRQNSWDWPSESAFDIQEIISGLPTIFPNQPDTILWRFNGGRFTTGSALTILQPAYPAVCWHHLLRGKFKIPRHCFILWLAILERLSTRDRPWMQQHNSSCVLCAGLLWRLTLIFSLNVHFARCLAILRHQVRFHWPGFGWRRDILWASKRWRGNHLFNFASRSLLAALTYHIWMERNRRIFQSTASSAEFVARQSIADVRFRIISENVGPSLQCIALYRIWKIQSDMS